eukprot:RCo039431
MLDTSALLRALPGGGGSEPHCGCPVGAPMAYPGEAPLGFPGHRPSPFTPFAPRNGSTANPPLPPPTAHVSSSAAATASSSADPEELTLSDFAWHHIPDCYRLPRYHALVPPGIAPGTATVEPTTGRLVLRLRDPAAQRVLRSGAVWREYAQPAWAIAPPPAETPALAVQWTQLQAIRPLPRETLATLLDELNCLHCLNCYVDLSDDSNGALDSEEAMLFKGAVVTGGGHLPLMVEKPDLVSTLAFLHDTFVVHRRPSFAELLSDPEAFLQFLLELHQRLMGSVGRSRGFEAGVLRTENVCLATARWCPPQFTEVPELLREYAQWAAEGSASLDPVVFAIELQCRLVYIHPFPDGNGRLARLLLNMALMEARYPPVVVGKSDKALYTTRLEGAFWGRKEPLYEFIAGLLLKSFALYFQSAGVPIPPTPVNPAPAPTSPMLCTRSSSNLSPGTSGSTGFAAIPSFPPSGATLDLPPPGPRRVLSAFLPQTTGAVEFGNASSPLSTHGSGNGRPSLVHGDSMVLERRLSGDLAVDLGPPAASMEPPPPGPRRVLSAVLPHSTGFGEYRFPTSPLNYHGSGFSKSPAVHSDSMILEGRFPHGESAEEDMSSFPARGLKRRLSPICSLRASPAASPTFGAMASGCLTALLASSPDASGASGGAAERRFEPKQKQKQRGMVIPPPRAAAGGGGVGVAGSPPAPREYPPVPLELSFSSAPLAIPGPSVG